MIENNPAREPHGSASANGDIHFERLRIPTQNERHVNGYHGDCHVLRTGGAHAGVRASLPGLRFACVGTYVPQACGIATFTRDLCTAIQEELGDAACCQVIAVSDGVEQIRFEAPVRFILDPNDVRAYETAADLVNTRGLDLLLVQHEFGIYGGPAGAHLLNLLREVRMPVVTTLHTILEKPEPEYREVMEQLVELSDRLVVMSYRGGELLQEVYGVPAARIELIPHGIPDLPFADSSFYKDQLDLMGRRVMLTFGLLSPGKGIEYAIQSLPELVDQFPELVYIVLGATHPKVRQHSGEAYRQSLRQLVSDLGLDDHVRFIDRYVELDELCRMLCMADIYITPYLGEQQAVSGTLAYALGAGKAIVSTPYTYAQEVLGGGRGMLVPFRDPGAIAAAVRTILQDEVQCQRMRKNAYLYSRNAVWAEVARSYVDLFRQTCARPGIDRAAASVRREGRRTVGGSARLELPPINYGHLRTLTDDTGILQHAHYTIPDRRHGYCTDDNARALVVALRAHRMHPSPEMLRLIRIYLSFLNHALNQETGRFRNFLSYSREWLEDAGSEDSHGRALWGLGVAVSHAPDEGTRMAALNLFDRALPAVVEFESPRAWAFSLLGIYAHLKRYSGDHQVRQFGERLVHQLAGAFQSLPGQQSEWIWPEERLTYANGKLPEALLLSGQWLGQSEITDIGLDTLQWLFDVQTEDDGRLSLVGNRGWYPRSGEMARFDQQPIEAQALLEAAVAAYQVTGDSHWVSEAQRCLEWFLGRNVVGRALYDPQTGGCRDGLHEDRLNENQGAESTLAWLLSIQSLHSLQHSSLRSAVVREYALPSVH